MSGPAEDTPTSPPALERVLGPIDATCIVVGAIIGVGIFFTPKNVALTAGSEGVAMLAWAVGGAIAMLGALCFAELGRRYPNTGGQYQVLRDAWGSMIGFVYVVCNATFIQAGAIAIIAVICVRNVGYAVGTDTTSVFVEIGGATLLIFGLSGANIVGVRLGSGIQNVTVYAKVLTLLAVTALALFSEPAAHGQVESVESISDATGGQRHVLALMFGAMVPAFFAFGGWQHALWIAGEVKRPKRNLPVAIIGGVALVVIVYVLANWAYFRLLGYDGVTTSGALAGEAVAAVWPGFGARAIAGAVAISAFGVLNAQFLSGPRLIAGMAEDGRFFPAFAHVSPRFRTPASAIVLLGVMSLLLLSGAYAYAFAFAQDGFDAIDKLLTGVVIVDGAFFALTGLALFVFLIRRKMKDTVARVVASAGVSLLFVAGEIGLLTGAFLAQDRPILFLFAGGWIVAAAMLYMFFFARRG